MMNQQEESLKACRAGLNDTLATVDAGMSKRMEALKKLKQGKVVDDYQPTVEDLKNAKKNSGTESDEEDLIEVTPRTSPATKNKKKMSPKQYSRTYSSLSSATTASGSSGKDKVVIELGDEGQADTICLDESDDEEEVVITKKTSPNKEHPSVPNSASLAAQAPACANVSPILQTSSPQQELPRLPMAAAASPGNPMKRRAVTDPAPSTSRPRVEDFGQKQTFVIPMPSELPTAHSQAPQHSYQHHAVSHHHAQMHHYQQHVNHYQQHVPPMHYQQVAPPNLMMPSTHAPQQGHNTHHYQ